MPITKIATCCYCGTRATLVLSGSTRHELACSSCGAPLHVLKMLKQPAPEPRSRPQPFAGTQDIRPAKAKRQKKSRKRERPRKSFKRRFLEEAWDVIEDIFD